VYDTRLSLAVVSYVWGTGGRPWPSRDDEAVIAQFGREAANLLARVKAVFDLVDTLPLDWSSEDLPAATKRVESQVRLSHPELDDAAIRAVGAQFSYSWR
jgi:hypothetical protein